MGIIQSRMERRKERLINQCETLNKSIFHLQTIENKTKENLKKMEKTKTECEKTLSRIDKTVKKRKQEYLKTKDIMECTICMERKVDCVLIPCGHLYCLECVKVLRECSHCRSKYNQIQKLFFI